MKELINLYSQMYHSMSTFQQVLFLMWSLCVVVFVVSYLTFWVKVTKSSVKRISKPQTF